MKTWTKYFFIALAAFTVAGCEDDTKTVYKPYSLQLNLSEGNELGLSVNAGQNIFINDEKYPVLANGQVSLYDVPAADEYLVYYPEPESRSGYVLNYHIPESQTYIPGKCDPVASPVYGLSDNEQLEDLILKPACGGLKLIIPAPEEGSFASVSSIKIESKEYVLTGDIRVDCKTGEVDYCDIASQTATLKGSIDISEGGEAVFTLPPLTFRDEITVTLNTPKGYGECFLDLKGKKIESGKMLETTLENIEWTAATNYYGTANSIIVAPGTTTVTVDCAPYATTSLLYAYENKAGDESLLARSAKLLWNDVSTSYISKVQLSDDRKSFTVSLNGEAGNAVIAIYDTEDPEDENANILWSFHIWVTDVAEQVLGANCKGNSYTVLDRNMGAVSATPGDWRSIGMLYQWGRKDPFVSGNAVASNTQATMYNESGTVKMQIASGSESKGTVAWATAHPDTYIKYSRSKSNSTTRPFYWSYDWMYYGDDALWGNPEGYNYPKASTLSKSIYDPCPKGYMVAPYDTWRNTNTTTSAIAGSVFSDTPDGWNSTYKGFSATWNGENLWYPAGGLLNRKTGGLQEVEKTGYYWCSTPMSANSANTGYMIVNSGVTLDKGNCRGNAYTVRCVKTK